MAVIYDRREINNQVLLIQFIFQSYDATNTNGNQLNLSLDKYLGLDVWSQIYKKLEPKILAFRNGDFSEEETTVNMNRAQLELNVSWKPVRSYHKDVARQFSGKSCDNSCAKVLNVKVRMFSALDKFKKLYGHEKQTEKISESTLDCESNASSSNAASENRTSNGSISQSLSQSVEEYVPEPLTDIPSSLNYTPSTLSNSIEDVVASPLVDDEHDVYTPSQKNGNNDSQIITYTPTKITQTSFKTASKKTDSNRNDSVDKKSNKMKKIFGDSGDEIDNDDDGGGGSQSGSRHGLRSTPGTSRIESDKTKVQRQIDEWVTKGRSKRTDSKRDCDRSDDKKKIRKIGTNGKTERSKKELNEDEKIRQLREQYEYEAMDDVHQLNVKTINLKEMKIEDIIKTFPKYQAALKEFFRRKSKIPDCRFQPDEDYLLVLELLDKMQQQKMYLHIRSEFADPVTEDHVTSDHENLFWMGMVPEWALLIFMDEFLLNRTDAIKQLTDQDRATCGKNFRLDLDSDTE